MARFRDGILSVSICGEGGAILRELVQPASAFSSLAIAKELRNDPTRPRRRHARDAPCVSVGLPTDWQEESWRGGNPAGLGMMKTIRPADSIAPCSQLSRTLRAGARRRCR